jgi:hypothetical protein
MDTADHAGSNASMSHSSILLPARTSNTAFPLFSGAIHLPGGSDRSDLGEPMTFVVRRSSFVVRRSSFVGATLPLLKVWTSRRRPEGCAEGRAGRNPAR